MITCEKLTEPGGRGFNALYEIYTSTISQSEQKPRHALEEMARSADYRLLTIGFGEEISGFSIFWLSPARNFALLEYMAVKESEQGKGIGSKLFASSVQTIWEGDGHLPVLIEVDSAGETTPDFETCLRRIRFYQRVGCRRVEGLHYLMPSVGQGVPPPMDLFVFRKEQADYVSKTDLKRWLTTIYDRVYQCGGDDPRIELMLRPLGDLIPLEPS
jgi:hypothetical protein